MQQFISEELARLRRCELLREAREQRLAAEVGRAYRDHSSRRRRFGSSRG